MCSRGCKKCMVRHIAGCPIYTGISIDNLDKLDALYNNIIIIA